MAMTLVECVAMLMKDLYVSHGSAILLLDDALSRGGEYGEIEDIVGEDILVGAVNAFIGKSLVLSDADREAGSLPSQIKAAATRQSIELPNGWKASVAMQLVSAWAKARTVLPARVLDAAAALFRAIRQRFGMQS